ncbi:hypothetical protein F5884DRAFT_852534 [Xylogone sp. PMI_703]|nr:hypothetical protein F5884DRAFT_852534 [Xylogone sp. PMI_703]
MEATSPSPPHPFPENLSIYQLARLNCRERVLVNPIQWTSLHLSLLQCSFENPQVFTAQSDSAHLDISKITGAGFVQKLFDRKKWSWRQFCTVQVLVSAGCPFTILKDLHFYFDQRHINVLPCVAFYLKDLVDKDHWGEYKGRIPPVAAYTDRERIRELRREYLRSRLGRPLNDPILGLFRLGLKKLTPENPLHDPYIVALLIGIAHRQRYSLQLKGQEDTNGSTFLAQVLYTDPDDIENIHVFAADVSSSFFQKLDFPSLPPPTSPSSTMSIKHIVLPRKPYRTFQRRLFQLLLSPRDKQDLHRDNEFNYRLVMDTELNDG